MEQKKEEAHILISGRVQGVSFRAFVEKHAKELGLKGHVKNLSDGRVEVLAQGDEHKISELISLCRKGPMAARVDDVKTDTKDLSEIEKEYEDFSISY